MKRKLLIALLSFGTIMGFGSGIFSIARHAHRGHQARRVAFENHVADVCVEAANRAQDRAEPIDDRPHDRPPPPRQDRDDWRGDHHRRDHPRDRGHRGDHHRPRYDDYGYDY